MSPNMIGDFFVGSGNAYFISKGFTRDPGGLINLGSIPTAGGTRRVKISENMSPIPRDRVFFDYNDFQNALFVPNPSTGGGYSTSVQRYMPGFEKTFFNGWASINIRASRCLRAKPKHQHGGPQYAGQVNRLRQHDRYAEGPAGAH